MQQKMTQTKIYEFMSSLDLSENNTDELDPQAGMLIEDLIENGSETALLVAITNIAIVAVEPHLSACSLRDPSDPINRRSVYKNVINPVLSVMVQEVQSNWVPSADPYASGPFVEEHVDAAWARARRARLKGAEVLHALLAYTDRHPTQAGAILIALLFRLRESLKLEVASVRVPPRVDAILLQDILADWLSEASRTSIRSSAIAEHLLGAMGLCLADGWSSVATQEKNGSTILLCQQKSAFKIAAIIKSKSTDASDVDALAEVMMDHQISRGYVLSERTVEPEDKDINEAYRHYANMGLCLSSVSIMRMMKAWLPLIEVGSYSEPSLLHNISRSQHLTVSDKADLSACIQRFIFRGENEVSRKPSV